MLFHNISTLERYLRVLVGFIFILSSFYWFTSFSGYILAFLLTLVGIILIVTGVVGWCPVFSMFNYSSRHRMIAGISKKEIERAVKEHPVSIASDLESIKAINMPLAPNKVTKKKPSTSKAKKKTSVSKAKSKVSSSVSNKSSSKKSEKKPKKTPTKKKPSKK